MKKVSFEQSLEGKEASQVDIWSKTLPCRGKSRCKDSQVGRSHLCLRSMKGPLSLVGMGVILECEQNGEEQEMRTEKDFYIIVRTLVHEKAIQASNFGNLAQGSESIEKWLDSRYNGQVEPKRFGVKGKPESHLKVTSRTLT